MNYCAECGFKIEGEFKFCPNCGSQIKAKSVSLDETGEKAEELIICKNCGEENSPENSNCFSCGVPLKGIKNSKPASVKRVKRSDQKKLNDENYSNGRIINTQGKVLDNKKILLVSSGVVVVVIITLLISGVFDTGVQNNITQMNDQSTGSGVNIKNLNEITDFENKIKADPEDLESTLHLAHLLQDSKLFEKAIANYKKYLEKSPEDTDARVDLGICFYNLADYTTAINEMESALKYQPKHQIAHLNLGIVNLTAGNVDVSKDWFRKTVELNPNSEAGKRAQELLNSH
jgi:cytochrome c-type biogenesis protein CcmH/NrfG